MLLVHFILPTRSDQKPASPFSQLERLEKTFDPLCTVVYVVEVQGPRTDINVILYRILCDKEGGLSVLCVAHTFIWVSPQLLITQEC